MSTSSSSYDWLTYVEKALLECDHIPLMGEVPAFDFNALESSLKNVLGLKDLTVAIEKFQWVNASALEDYQSHEMTFLNFSILPIEGKVSACLAPKDVKTLVHWVVHQKTMEEELAPSQFEQGLISYVSTLSLACLQSHPFFEGFLLRYLPLKMAPSTRCLCMDVTLTSSKEKLALKLFIPERFRKNWLAHFLQRPSALSHQKLNATPVELSLELGQFFRSIESFKQIQPGDFIPVPSIQVDPHTHTGSLNLCLDHKPLFRIRLKDKGFKILEQTYFPKETPMNDDEFSDDLSSSNYSEQNEASLEDEMDFSEEKEAQKASHSPEVTLEKISQVALNVSVELSRFQMTCEKLMQLKPGNLLELDIPFEKPVDLVVQNKVVAQGELIRVGETVGVRILNIRS